MKPFNRFAVLSTVSALASLLAACGGGGGGYSGGGGGGGGGTTYDVSGTITGLTTSGLVLQNNGGNSQNVAANATSFKFTGVANGPYAVTVQTQPSGTTCGVTNGSGTVNGANVSNVNVSCSNVLALSVNPGPAAAADQTFNDLLASVIVCPPNSRTGCVTINNVLVDTGSEGLRLMKSVLTSAGLSLTPLADPSNAANSIHECLPFADGYSWGAVAMAGVQIGGESVASLPVQVIDDSASPSPAAPTTGTCTSNGAALNSVNAFDANGVIGVGVLVQDCDPVSCLAATSYYYSCSSGGTCNPTTLAAADEVANPVASFATDNNGVIVQLQAIPDTGAATATGTLTFGIGTEGNNALGGSVTILDATALDGYFTTTPSGQKALMNSFIDSGSNALFVPSSLTPCVPPPTGIDSFYCPGNSSSLSLATLSATNQGATNGNVSQVMFNIANLQFLAANDGSNFALDDVGGPAAKFNNITQYFDWGLPFFYGRTIYFAIEGKAAGGTNGPYYAY